MKKKILPSTSVIDSPRKGWMTLAPCVLGVAKVGVEVGTSSEGSATPSMRSIARSKPGSDWVEVVRGGNGGSVGRRNRRWI